MSIKTVGPRQVLLTSAELQCFKVARSYQRKVLVRRLLKSDYRAVTAGFGRLGWSKNPVILAIQWVILIIAAPFLLAWLLLRLVVSLLLFPFRYVYTYFTPTDLAAPGEKTLVGIYNAFNRYMNLDAASYIACLNDWIRILYGEEVFRKYNVNGYLSAELERLGIDERKAREPQQFTPHLRSILSVSREKLSKTLGHYLKQQKQQTGLGKERPSGKNKQP